MATEIDSHFLFDSAFFDEVLSTDGSINKLAYQLTYITSHASSSNRRRQNKISPKSFDFIVAKNPTIDPRTLQCPLNRVEVIEGIELDQDETSRTIKYAVYFTLFPPFKTIIFTSTAKQVAYTASPHLAGLERVSVVSGPTATQTIDTWFKKCREGRESSCN